LYKHCANVPVAEAAQVNRAKEQFPSLKHAIATHFLDAGAELAVVNDWLDRPASTTSLSTHRSALACVRRGVPKPERHPKIVRVP
jgi:site-specific recombinase XerD